MKALLKQVVIIGVSLALGYCISQFLVSSVHEKVYICDLAEISIDFTPEMRDECRKLRLNKNENRTSK
jgi:hypothetical protein